MDCASLYDLITYLEYGTKLHIGVLFFGSRSDERLVLPHKSTVHTGALCDRLKARPNGLRRCFKCRSAAIRRAIKTGRAFGGLCINGVYEYTRPVSEGAEVFAVIFIGNIYPVKDEKILSCMQGEDVIADTMERDFSFEQCEAVGTVVESYIRMILATAPPKRENTDFNPLIENMKNYIEANLEYDIDLSLLSGIFHYNEKYLGRLFKKKTGISFNSYLNKRRVECAARMLTDSADTVITISERVGFNNVTYFNRVFKRQFGCTPGEYRTGRAEIGFSTAGY